MWRMRIVWMCLLLALLPLLMPSALLAQQCAVGVVGPFSLSATEEVKVCGNNLFGTGTLSVGIATFDALNSRAPVDLRFVRIAPHQGFCLVPQLPAARESLGRTVREVLVQVGVVTQSKVAVPLALTVQRSAGGDYNGDAAVDAADYVIWRSSFGTTNPPV